MFRCPKCNCGMSSVIESRPHVIKGESIQVRKRKCKYCGHNYRTREVIDNDVTIPSGSRRRKDKVTEINESIEADIPEEKPGKNPFT